MIVGKKDIPLGALKRACTSSEALIAFATELVPTPLRHIPEITNNQKYYVALLVRSTLSLKWEVRTKLCAPLLEGVRIKGIPDAIYDYDDLIQEIDPEAFMQYRREDFNAQR